MTRLEETQLQPATMYEEASDDRCNGRKDREPDRSAIQ